MSAPLPPTAAAPREVPWTKGPWFLEGNWDAEKDEALGGWISCFPPAGVALFELIPVTGKDEHIIANAKLLAAAPQMAEALRAHHAWSYAEDKFLGTFDMRTVLCSYAQHLTARALAAADGSADPGDFSGPPRLVVWPTCEIQREDAEAAQALVEAVLDHQRAALLSAGAGR